MTTGRVEEVVVGLEVLLLLGMLVELLMAEVEVERELVEVAGVPDVELLDAEVVPLQELELASTAVKLAQVMRVVLPKWNTKLRFPKKAPIPSTVEAKLSV